MKKSKINPAMRRLAFEIRGLTYEEMLDFAQGVGTSLGVLEHSPTGMTEDELTSEVIAAALSGWVDEHLEDGDR